MWRLLVVIWIPLVSASSCPFGYTAEPDSDKCYRVYSSSTTYFSAQYTCTEDGANLASITNGFENTFVGSLLPYGISYFIGLNKLVNPSQYTWLDETPVYYTNFYPNQIYNESCVSFMATYNSWFVTPCSRTLPFICSATASSTCPTCPKCNGTCTARCDSGWAYFDQTHSCYRAFKKGTWRSGEDTCQSAGGHLASIHSDAENSFVIEIASDGVSGSDSDQPLIGLQRLFDGTWAWTDGSPLNYTHWYPGRPRTSSGYECAYVFTQYSGSTSWDTMWENSYCSDVHRAFVCKKPAY